MLSSKRSSVSSSKSSKSSGSLSHQKPQELKVPDIKDFSNVPLIKQLDNGRLLPKYTSVLARNAEQGVAMDDLHQLQQDLEKLLSTNALRTRFFLGEYSQAHQKESQHDKRGHDRVCLKRKRPDDKLKYKDLKSGMRVTPREGAYKNVNKIISPRNDNSDKFWVSIEPYCAPVTKDNLAFLDALLKEFGTEIDNDVPEIGEHYATTWSDDLINDEQNVSKSGKKSVDVKKNGLYAMIESFGTPYTPQLLSASIQDHVLKSTSPAFKNFETGVKVNKGKSSDLSKMRHSIGQKVGTCLDKKLLKVLLEEGILSNEDVNKGLPEDEILTEIKKCQQELITVNDYNVQELNKLRCAVLNDIHCNQLKNDLHKVDKEILELYNNIMAARLQDEGKDYGKIFSESAISEFEGQAHALLRQQHILNREIDNTTDMSMLY